MDIIFTGSKVDDLKCSINKEIYTIFQSFHSIFKLKHRTIFYSVIMQFLGNQDFVTKKSHN